MKMTGLVDLRTLKHYGEATEKGIKDAIEKMSEGVKLKIPDLNETDIQTN
jgi:hypothetical protein